MFGLDLHLEYERLQLFFVNLLTKSLLTFKFELALSRFCISNTVNGVLVDSLNLHISLVSFILFAVETNLISRLGSFNIFYLVMSLFILWMVFGDNLNNLLNLDNDMPSLWSFLNKSIICSCTNLESFAWKWSPQSDSHKLGKPYSVFFISSDSIQKSFPSLWGSFSSSSKISNIISHISGKLLFELISLAS